MLAAAERHGGFVIPLAWVHLDCECAGDVAAYAGAGFRGLKVIDPQLPYNHANYLPIYEAAARHRLPILFHAGIKARVRDSVAGLSEHHRPVWLDDVARRYPECRLVLAHVGAPWYDEAFMVVRLNPNVYLELTSGSGWQIKGMDGEYFRKRLWWPQAWKKVLFGSDVPPDRLGWAVETYEALLPDAGLDAATQEDVYYNNCMRLWEA